MNNAAQYKVGTSKRVEMMNSNNSPGPGNYKISLIDRHSAPKFGFGSGIRDGGRDHKFPGPGQYTTPGNVGREGSSPTIHKKLEYQTIDQTPGPGAYESSLKTRKTAPSYGQGTQKRNNSSSNFLVPAANTYFPTTTFTTKGAAKWGFGTEKRKDLSKTGQSPGPGNYELKSAAFSDRPRFFMGEKLAGMKDNMNVPGPGNYNPDTSHTIKKLPQYSMKQKLGSSIGANGVNSPAPGAYDIHLKN
jgi:hypothetical protein